MDIYWKLFGERLKRARTRIVPKLTQARLAEAVGVQPPSVSRWENNVDFPEEFRLPEICKAVGVSLEYFERRPEITPPARDRAIEKVIDAVDLLSKFGALKPAHRDLVLAVVYDDDSKIVDGDEVDWPQWLIERLSKQST